ncbi:MAG TPA: hypothetical protein VGX50_02245 [Longimicrobium sp.]|jgi:hypothetical protein|nr:hypothetical protein [Longimicrobium sp.]
MHRPHRHALAALFALLLLAACDDGPTAPTSYVQHVAGATWVAVTEPAGLPRVDTWLPYVPAESAAGRTLREMRDQAAKARSAAHVEEALRLEDEMMRLAARSLARAPEPARVLAGAAALESWADRARARLETGSFPELAATVATVSAHAHAARTAVATGDNAGAVLHVTDGAIAARQHAPLAVGLRLMAAVEARLGPSAGESAGVRRARHLLADAREGLATGDSVRALRRAVYALQLLEAEGIVVPSTRSGTVDSLRPLQ